MKKYYLIIIGIVSMSIIGNEEDNNNTFLHNKVTDIKNEYRNNSRLNIGMNIGTIAGGLTTGAGLYLKDPGTIIIGTTATIILGSAELIFNCISCCQNHNNDYNDDDL